MIGIMTALILVGNPTNISTTNTIQNVAQPIVIESQVVEAVQEEIYIQEQTELGNEYDYNNTWRPINQPTPLEPPIEEINYDDYNGWLPIEFTAIEIIEE